MLSTRLLSMLRLGTIWIQSEAKLEQIIAIVTMHNVFLLTFIRLT